MKLTFHGGVGEVTGSRHLLEVDSKRLLLDCGLFQGHRRESIQKNLQLPFDPKTLDAVLLSHAHIDHSGGLPILTKKGFAGPIQCTRPTIELCGVMLLDSAHLQEADAEFFNKLHARAGDEERIQPLYTVADAQASLGRFEGHEYGAAIALSGRLRARLHNAGHVLGSAMIEVEYDVPTGGRRRVLFTGDLGRRRSLLMEPPGVPKNVDYLLVESTYGDRLHQPIALVERQLRNVVERAVAERGKILIPSFALERTQEIVFVLEGLRRERKIPDIPVYVDSPMAVSLTEIFERHRDGFRAEVASSGDPFGFGSVRYVRSVEESQGLNDLPGPLVILSASGMCEGGRILHHLRNNLEHDNTTVLIAGYQAKGTLGRRLVEGAKRVKIFGLEHEVWARVEQLQTLSAHADKDDLLAFIKALSPRPRRIFLVHGDPEDRTALKAHLKAEGIDRVELPEFGQSFELD